MYINFMKKIDHRDSNLYCPTSIKDTIWWFPFPTIMENTENILKPNKEIIPSLLNVFAMFQLILFYDKE